MQQQMIQKQVFSDMDIVQLRESFAKKYCSSKNWDKTNLSYEQILEIQSNKEWKSPGLLHS